jgi:hypothetical protein
VAALTELEVARFIGADATAGITSTVICFVARSVAMTVPVWPLPSCSSCAPPLLTHTEAPTQRPSG